MGEVRACNMCNVNNSSAPHTHTHTQTYSSTCTRHAYGKRTRACDMIPLFKNQWSWSLKASFPIIIRSRSKSVTFTCQIPITTLKYKCLSIEFNIDTYNHLHAMLTYHWKLYSTIFRYHHQQSQSHQYHLPTQLSRFLAAHRFKKSIPNSWRLFQPT